jgi:hypothetical protein
MSVDISPFSFRAEQIDVRKRDKIMVEIFCFEQMGVFYQICLIPMLPEKINELKYTPIQTGFLFERLKEGAMINKKINFIHYTPDYRIEKIDFE